MTLQRQQSIIINGGFCGEGESEPTPALLVSRGGAPKSATQNNVFHQDKMLTLIIVKA